MYPHNIHINIYVCIKTLENQSSSTESAIPGKKKKYTGERLTSPIGPAIPGSRAESTHTGGGPKGWTGFVPQCTREVCVCVCVCRYLCEYVYLFVCVYIYIHLYRYIDVYT